MRENPRIRELSHVSRRGFVIREPRKRELAARLAGPMKGAKRGFQLLVDASSLRVYDCYAFMDYGQGNSATSGRAALPWTCLIYESARLAKSKMPRNNRAGDEGIRTMNRIGAKTPHARENL